MKNYLAKFLFLSFFIIGCLSLSEINAQKKNLTYNQVFSWQGDRLLNPLPNIYGWLDNDDYLELKQPFGAQAPKLMIRNVSSGKEELFIDYDAINKQLGKGFQLEHALDVSKNYDLFLLEKERDVYYFNINNDQFVRLTDSKEPENNPSFSPDGKKIAFTQGHNLYVIDIAMETVKQLTFDGSDVILNGWSSWIYMEEILGRSTGHKAYYWSPNSDKIAFLRFDDSQVPKFPIYDSDGTHGSLEWQAYPKPGDPNPKVKLGIVDVDDGDLVWIDTDEKKDEYIAWPLWTPDGSQLFFQWMNRLQNNLKIYSADPLTGNKKEVYNENQTTWTNWIKDLTFLNDGSGFIVRSNRQGWLNLYLYNLNGKEIAKLVDTEWDVNEINLVDEENRMIYFTGTGENSTEAHLFSVHMDKLVIDQITNAPGTHSVTLSPDGYYFIDEFSAHNIPANIKIYNTESKKIIHEIGDRKSEIMDQYNLGKVELFSVPTPDGYDLPVKWYLPPDFSSTKKYPVIISIYGGPERKSVTNSWGRGINPYYYASKGIIYMNIDHRGSGHFGKEVSGQLHRSLGKWEIYDYSEIIKWLRKLQYIDETKIGITGGSYGGYLTALALTKGSEYFTHGIAGSGVMDWRLYDNVYTERFMGFPTENKAGYNYASVLTYADKLKGKLLITHGMMDDNVHMQNSIQLIDKLQLLNKDFEMMFYPNERHGVRQRYYHARETDMEFWLKNYFGKTLDEIIAEEES